MYEERTESKGLEMMIQYTPKQPDISFQTDRLEQGTDFLVEVTVKNPETGKDQEELVLSQIFPSGWEILNQRLFDPAVGVSQQIDYQDIRDDRVYTYFDLKAGESKSIQILLNASYIGEYYLPSVQCEAMYDNLIYARIAGKRTYVTDSGR